MPDEVVRRLEATDVTLVVGCAAGITPKEAAEAITEMERLINATGKCRVWIGISGFKPYEPVIPERNDGHTKRRD